MKWQCHDNGHEKDMTMDMKMAWQWNDNANEIK